MDISISVSLGIIWDLNCNIWEKNPGYDFDPKDASIDGHPFNVCTDGPFSCDPQQRIVGYNDTQAHV